MLHAPLPLFRDLNIRDKGDDVRASQKSLNAVGFNVRVAGVVDASLRNTIAKLFDTHDVVLCAQAYIPHRQFVLLHIDSAVVIHFTALGTALNGEAPFVTLKTTA